MKRLPLLLRSTPPSPRTPSVTRMPRHAGRPHHPRRMELHELHVHELGAGAIGQRLAVARVFPAVAGDLEGAADAARGQHDGFGREQLEAAALAVVSESADDAARIRQQIEDRVLHVHFDALMNAVILQGADHLEAGAVARVRQARIAVAAEVALQNFAVFGAIENRAPGFELVHARRRLFRVQLRHARIVQILPAAHRVGEMDAPVVAIVDIAHRRRHAAFGHHGVRFAEQRFADQSDFDARAPRLRWPRADPRRPRRSPARRARTSDIRPSRRISSRVQTPIEHMRT